MSHYCKDKSVAILYLTHSCPVPPHSGDRIRNFNILKHLSERYDVHLVYPSLSADDLRQVSTLEKYCTSVQTVRLYPFFSKMRCAFGFFIKKPLTLTYFYSRQLKSLVSKIECDIILVDCSSMAQYVTDIGKPKIIDFVDVDYDKWLLYAENVSFLKSIFYIIEYLKLKKYEYVVSEIFDHCIAVSENERKLLPSAAKVTVIPNGIDVELPHEAVGLKGNFLIFIGVMKYFPNIDAVLFFHDKILPLIKKKFDKLKFVIVGSSPAQQVKNLESEHVIVTGFVPNPKSYLSQSSVCVVPLRIAKGVQNKILEAMMMEVPVVATYVANQGIGARHNHEIIIADNPTDFAAATVALMCDKALRKKITTNAKVFVMENFRWQVNLQKLDDVISSLITS